MAKAIWTKPVIVFILAILLVAASLLGACSSDDETAPTKTDEAAAEATPVSLKIGFIGDFTGATATFGATAAGGFIDYFKYLNESKGGINGNPVDMDWVDCKFETSLALEAYHRMVEQNALCIAAVNSPYVAAAMPFLAKNEMPFLTFSNNLPFVHDENPDIPNAYLYGISSCAPEEYTSFIEWALERWEEDRPMRLVLVYPDNSYGLAMLDGFPEWVQERDNVEIVEEVTVEMNLNDASAALVKVKKANPDYILVRLMANGIVVFLKDAQEAGVDAPVIGNYISRPSDVKRMATSPDHLDQYMMANFFGMMEDESEGMDMARELAQKYQGKPVEDLGALYWWGMGAAMIVEESLRLAIEAEGAENLNSSIVKQKGFDKVTNLDTKGLAGSVTITSTDHRSVVQHRIVGFENGEAKVLRDWTDNAPIVDWSK